MKKILAPVMLVAALATGVSASAAQADTTTVIIIIIEEEK